MSFIKKSLIKMKSYDDEGFFFSTVILLALILGIVVRLQFVSGSKYPLNDGGLFYKMVEDLLANNLKLPQFTSYNLDNIPYAYPPLAFYVTAIIHLFTGLSLLSLFKIIPVLINILTLPAFYFFSRTVTGDRILASLSLLFFALVPRAFEWFVMGGGISRSFGFLFAILALKEIWELFSTESNWKIITRAVLFSSATVLSHPEIALFVIYASIMFFFYHRPNLVNVKYSLLIGLGVLVVTAPWTYSVYNYHNLEPFISAGGSGHKSWFEIINLITLNFGFENGYFLTFYGVLALIALFIKRERLVYFLYAFLVLGYIVFPRGGDNLLTIPVSILAAYGLGVLINISSDSQAESGEIYKSLDQNRMPKVVFAFVVMYLFLGAYTYKYIFGKNQLRLSDEIIQTYQWLDEHANPDDVIMIYPTAEGNRFWWNDYVAEWFPALTSKRSVTTVQGYEWIPSQFDKKINSYSQLRSCGDIGPECVLAWEIQNQMDIDYLVLDQITKHPDLVNSYFMDSRYTVVYQNAPMIIFEKME